MIKRLLLLSGLAIVAVVVAHAAQWVWVAMFWWTDRYLPVSVPNYDLMGTPSYYGVVILQKLAVFAVPAFLFATGFFASYASRGTHGKTWKLVGARLKVLLIPYLIWSLVIFVGDYLQGIVYTFPQYLSRLLLGKAVETYWYVFVLIQLYLLFPFIVPIAIRRPKLLLVATGTLLLAVIGFFYWKLYVELSGANAATADVAIRLIPGRSPVRWIFFLTLGIVSGCHLQSLKAFLSQTKWILLATAVISFPLAVIETEWIFQQTGMDWRAGAFTLPGGLYAVSMILAFMAFEHTRVPFPKLGYELGGATFGIYLLHRPVLEFSARATQKFLPQVLAYPVVFQMLLMVLAVGVPFAFMRLVARSPAKRWYRYLFG